MPEELQHLIDRIRRDGVDHAEREAEQILLGARAQADELIAASEERAGRIVAKAEQDAATFAEAGKRNLEQAARDLLITVGAGVESMLNDLAGEAVEEAMDIDFLQEVLGRVIDAYVEKDGSETRIDVLASPADQQRLIDFFRTRYHAAVKDGITVLHDADILQGFKVSSAGGHVHHEFTREAIAEAISDFLRPHLSEIVHRVAFGDPSSPED